MPFHVKSYNIYIYMFIFNSVLLKKVIYNTRITLTLTLHNDTIKNENELKKSREITFLTKKKGMRFLY